MLKQKKFEETQQPSEPDSYMPGMRTIIRSIITRGEFETTVINMPGALMEKTENIQEQMGNQRDGNSKKE